MIHPLRLFACFALRLLAFRLLAAFRVFFPATFLLLSPSLLAAFLLTLLPLSFGVPSNRMIARL
jgi:hypothetical protein